jgi:hypothetical protein
MAVKVKKAVLTKKVAAAKTASKSVAKGKPVAKSSVSRKISKKGDLYECKECGLVIAITEPCGCYGVCDIICCGESMVFKTKK